MASSVIPKIEMRRKSAGNAVRKNTLIGVKGGQAFDGHGRSDTTGVGTPRQRPSSARTGSKEWISAQGTDYMNPLRLFQGARHYSAEPIDASAVTWLQNR